MKTITAAALKYAEKGWLVFPLFRSLPTREGENETAKGAPCTCGKRLCPDSGKHPAIESGLKGATKDKSQIKDWFENGDYNIGIVTGEDSNLTVIDIDIGLKGGAETWRALNEKDGEPETLYCQTGSGGVHAYFLYNSVLPTSSNTLGDGVDVRNDGGYVIAPPSNHRSGNFYSWANDNKVIALPKHLSKRKETRGRPKKDDPTNRKYTIEEAKRILEFIDYNDREVWRQVGIILGREFDRATEAWDLYIEWANQWQGTKQRNHDEIMREAFNDLSQTNPTNNRSELTIATLVKAAMRNGWTPKSGMVNHEKFLYYAPDNTFIYLPTGDFWPKESVNAACSMVNENGTLIRPNAWLKENRLVTSMICDPSIDERVTKEHDSNAGVIVQSEGAALYNSYRKPDIIPSSSDLAKPWVDHVYRLFDKDGDADAFLNYMAHRRQFPGEKPRFCLLIAGEQGVGKDTAISMTYSSFGIWNVANIEPNSIDSPFNEYVSSTLIVISEAASHQDMTKWAFNERLKVIVSGTPDFISINPKYGSKYHIRLHCGVILTTNHLMDGLYIPPDDRRYDVIECATKHEMQLEDPAQRGAYFQKLWKWFNDENGAEAIVDYLDKRDISQFDASTGQRLTDAHRQVVSAGLVADSWLLDVIEELGVPPVVEVLKLYNTYVSIEEEPMNRQSFFRKAPHALGRIGYKRYMHAERSDGRVSLDLEGKKQLITLFYKPSSVQKHEVINCFKKNNAERF